MRRFVHKSGREQMQQYDQSMTSSTVESNVNGTVAAALQCQSQPKCGAVKKSDLFDH